MQKYKNEKPQITSLYKNKLFFYSFGLRLKNDVFLTLNEGNMRIYSTKYFITEK
jgi:hypothetical protein